MRRLLIASALAVAVGGAACTPGVYRRNVEARITGPATMTVGSTAQLEAVLQYSDSTSQVIGPSMAGAVDWQSSNTAVATVSASGLLTARAPGTVTITATPSATTTGTGSRTPGTLTVKVTE